MNDHDPAGNMPLAPLWAAVERNWNGPETSLHPTVFSARDFALALNVNTRNVQRWRHRGIQWWTADRLAVHLGTHPSLIWPDHWPIDEEVAS